MLEVVELDGAEGVGAHTVVDGAVVDEDVDPAEALDGGRGEVEAALLLGEVEGEIGGDAAELVDLLGDLLAGVGVDLSDDDLGALVGEGLGVFPADPLAGAGHDGNPVLEAHVESLPAPMWCRIWAARY